MKRDGNDDSAVRSAWPLLVAGLLAGCGGGARPAPVNTQAVNACAESLYVAHADSANVDDICTTASREGLLTADGTLTPAAQDRLLQQHRSFYEPLCAASLLTVYEQVPAETSTTVTIDSAGLAQRACAAIVAGHLATGNGNVDPATLTRLFRAHPELGAPILYAGLLESYDTATRTRLKRADFVQAAQATARAAWTQGVVSVTSLRPLNLHIDTPRLGALFQSELANRGRSA